MRFTLLPSVLPDISPTRGEIGSGAGDAIPAAFEIRKSVDDGLSPPVWGRCPAGQRGVRRSAAKHNVAGAIVLISLVLQGCARNSVRELSNEFAQSSQTSTLMILGIASPTGASLGIDIQQVDPVTGKGGDCSRFNRAEMVASGDIQYHVFKVPAGTYAAGWTTKPVISGKVGNAFSVPAGVATYVGDFHLKGGLPGSLDNQYEFHRDIALAQAGLPRLAKDLRLAKIVTIPTVTRLFVCTP